MGNWWPFGVNQGLHFSPGSIPTSNFKRLNDAPYYMIYPYNARENKIDGEGLSNAISDCNDSLLFYSKFDSLISWKQKNFTNANYYNGTSKGHYIQQAYSPAIIIPIPQKENNFLHIRTLYVAYGERPNQVFAHIASQVYANRKTNQINLVKGKERIRLPIDSIFSTSAYSADELFRMNLTWTPHEDGVNLWVLDLYNDSTLHAFLVDSSGININPVSSFIRGNVSLGNIRISHDGRKLAVSGVRPTQSKIYSTWLYDFDASTGKASNGRGILKHSDHPKTLSNLLEFSAKDSFLYISTHTDTLIFGNKLIQYNLNLKRNILLDVLPNQYSSNTWRLAGLQLGPDNKIYGSYINWNLFNVDNFAGNYLSCIQYPDCEGTACHFKRDSIFFKYSIGWGLPNPYHYPVVLDAYIHPMHICEDTTTIRIDAKWFKQLKINWGDGDSVIYNKREWLDKPDQRHFYKKEGKYVIKLSGYMPPCNNFYAWQDSIVVIKNPISDGYSLTENSLCGKYQIILTDKTKNAYKLKVNWGNGSDSTFSGSINAIHYYDTSGSYLLKYSVYAKDTLGVQGCKLSFSDTIRASINSVPRTLLTVDDASKCQGDTFIFKNFSTLTDSIFYSIDNIKGRVGNNPIIPLGIEKSGTIQFISKNNNGCLDTFSQYLEVKEKPKALFIWDNICNKTITNFLYTGTVPAIPVTTTFNWDINGEDTSTKQNPSKLFDKAGKKIISLVMNSSNGCKDSITKELLVRVQSKAQFKATDVCENDSVLFTNESKDADSYNWKFGDGQFSISTTPKHLYSIGGITKTFNVKLIVVISNGCSDSIIKPVTVNANPVSDFSYLVNGNQVSFKAKETNGLEYKWNFGDGGFESTPNAQTSYTYSKFPSGNYNACLRVTNSANCSTETCKAILITGGIYNLGNGNKLGVGIFPNPTDGNFTISIKQPQSYIEVTIYSILGKEIETISTKEDFTATLPVNLSLNNGTYILKIDNGGFIGYYKLVVRKL
jgi:PKD repeat protein